MKEEGIFWHVHHDQLLEYCYSCGKRQAFIVLNKLENEIETRIALLQPVRGKLPPMFETLAEEEKKVRIALHKATDKLDHGVYTYGYLVHKELLGRYNEAYNNLIAVTKEFQAMITNHIDELLALHKEECGCNWTPEAGIELGKGIAND